MDGEFIRPTRGDLRVQPQEHMQMVIHDGEPTDRNRE